MAFDRDEVLRIAALARLRIEADETEALARDLERIVAFMGRLREVALPRDAGDELDFDEDVHREDRPAAGLDRDEALRNAPDTDGVHLLVPPVLRREQP